MARYGASLWRYPFLSTAAIFEDIYRRKIWDHEGGADIVEKLVQENRRKYRATAKQEPGAEAPRRRFVALDVCASDLPPADVVFCRDCLVHLSNKRVSAALENIKRSKAEYLLMTTFPSRRKNRNTVSGA